ncbi:MAG: hypothetical protein J0I41_03790 [Filimonas sp.]|nr:hypothetical protein [Filimonas sp.]
MSKIAFWVKANIISLLHICNEKKQEQKAASTYTITHTKPDVDRQSPLQQGFFGDWYSG